LGEERPHLTLRRAILIGIGSAIVVVLWLALELAAR
jgi:hypothetical protein